MIDNINSSNKLNHSKEINNGNIEKLEFSEGITNEKSVIVYDIKNYTYSELKNYKNKDIFLIINSFPNEKSIFIQINNDEILQNLIIQSITKKFLDKGKSKLKELSKLCLDYCLNIDKNLVCLNLGILSEFIFHDIEKYLIQLYIFDNGVFLFNKTGNPEVFNTIKNEYNFKLSTKFTDENLEMLYHKGKYSYRNLIKNSLVEGMIKPTLSMTHKEISKRKIGEYSIEGLIYHLINITLEKLKTFVLELAEDSKSLNIIYMEISENERNDFHRRIENTEIFILLMMNETYSKKNLIEYIKNNYCNDNFEEYNEKFSVFLFELLIAKTKQIEIKFNQVKFSTNMLKENYNIILDDNSKKNKDKLNQIIKIISFISVFFMPFNILSTMFGMNIRIPFSDWDNMIPFFLILFMIILFIFVHIFVFKKYNFI